MKYKWMELFCVLLSVLLLFSAVHAAEDTLPLMEAVPMPEPESADLPFESELSMMAQAQEESPDAPFFANGRPITIRQIEDGTTWAFDATEEKIRELTSEAWVFGGFLKEDCDSTSVTMESGEVKGIYGGGGVGNVTGTAKVVFTGGTLKYLYGGGCYEEAETGNTVVTISGEARANSVYGGGDKGAVTGTATLTIEGGIFHSVCGGGNIGKVENTEVLLNGGKIIGTVDETTGKPITGNAYGGGRLGSVTNASLTLDGASVEFVFGGGEQANVQKASVHVNSGDVRIVYGGALKSVPEDSTDLVHVVETTVKVTGGSAIRVFGGGKEASTGTANVQVSGGEISSGVYGGGETGTTDTTSVTVLGGSIPEVCGGGGKGATASSTVKLKSGKVGTVYGGGKESASDDITVTVDGGTAKNLVCGSGIEAGTQNIFITINDGEIEKITSGNPANLGGNPLILTSGTVWEIENGITVKDKDENILFPVDIHVLDGEKKGLPNLSFKIRVAAVNGVLDKTVTTNSDGYIRLYLPEGNAKFKATISGKDYDEVAWNVISNDKNRINITLGSGVTLYDDGKTVRFHGMGVEEGDLAVAAKFTADGKLSEIDTAKIESGSATMTKNIGNGWKLFVMSGSYAPRCEAIALA